MKIYEIVAGYKLSTILKILLVAILIYSPIFGHLSRLPIRIWDESRLAINAYEMYRDGGCLVTTFEGKPDHWNTKPPLLIWLQVLAMKAHGVGELAVPVIRHASVRTLPVPPTPPLTPPNPTPPAPPLAVTRLVPRESICPFKNTDPPEPPPPPPDCSAPEALTPASPSAVIEPVDGSI